MLRPGGRLAAICASLGATFGGCFFLACGLAITGTAAEDGGAPAYQDTSAGDLAADRPSDGAEGTVEADASIDATTPRCPDDGAPCDRVVFVTRAMYMGDLGGVDGADDKCAAVASASSHPRIAGRSFIAWIGASASSPATRLDRRGRFVRVDGAPLAESWSDLVDGTLANMINLDEKELVVPDADDDVWTGVEANGTGSPVVCAQWKSSSPNDTGSVGFVDHVDMGWTAGRSNQTCNSPSHIYCFER